MPHTPGPWESSEVLITAENGREITHTGVQGCRKSSHTGQSGSDEDVLNARLIAAAPELLNACRLALEDCRMDDWEGSDLAIELRRVIAKATELTP